MRRKLKVLQPYASVMSQTMLSLCESGNFGISIFDNSQIIRNQKYQRDSHCSSVTLATSRCFVKPVIPDNLDSFEFSNQSLLVTCVNQAIPSPPQMPMYEKLGSINIDAFSFNDQDSGQDTSGGRVESYCGIAQVASTIAKFKRIIPRSKLQPFHFQIKHHVDSMDKLNIQKLLSPNAISLTTYNNRCFYTKISLFQHDAVKNWRGKSPKVALLIPPVSPEDETTNIGPAKVVLSLLTLFGILEVTQQDGSMEGNLNSLKLTENYKERYLMVVGDGLSQLRIRTFTQLIDDTCFRFDPKTRVTEMIHKALRQIVHVPGDLHGGCFHFLSAIYSIFYAALLQPIQTLLGWKKICGTDVSKCYQQAAGMALMIGTEIDRMLISAYLHSMATDDNQTEVFTGMKDSEELAVHIANGYLKWKNDKTESTTDQYFKMCLTYTRLLDMYMLFRQSIRAGDSVTIEWLYKEFLPIFAVTKKMHCVELVISNMEHLYGQLSGKLLHFVRINRTQPLYDGVDKSNKPMAHWPLDGIIELLQKYYHKMRFDNSDYGWMSNSHHIMLLNKSKRYANDEFHKVTINDARLVDHVDIAERKPHAGEDSKRLQTAIPNRAKEHHAIAEMLYILNVGDETPHRVYSKKDVWRALSRITTEIRQETDKYLKDTLRKELLLTPEEIAIDEITDNIFRNENDPADTHQLEHETQFSDDNDSDTDEGNDENDAFSDKDSLHNIRNDRGDDYEMEFVVGLKHKVKTKRAKLNPLAFKDVFAIGNTILQKKNFSVARLQKSRRQERKVIIRKGVYYAVHAITDGLSKPNDAAPQWFLDACCRLES